MWSQDQLDQATYVCFHEDESKRPMNVGTIDIGKGQFGPYILTPVPPFGGLTGQAEGDGSIAGLKMGVRVPMKAMSIAYQPKSWPVPVRPGDETPLHQYGDGTV
jgi:hypothetical protein